MNHKMTLEDIVKRHHDIANKTTNYKEESKKRLQAIGTKKIQTTMIGALNAIEDIFGFLWGMGKEDISDVEADIADMYQTLRKRILDNGNNQMKALENELKQYDVVWNRYSMVLEFKGEDGQNAEQSRDTQQDPNG